MLNRSLAMKRSITELAGVYLVCCAAICTWCAMLRYVPTASSRTRHDLRTLMEHAAAPVLLAGNGFTAAVLCWLHHTGVLVAACMTHRLVAQAQVTSEVS